MLPFSRSNPGRGNSPCSAVEKFPAPQNHYASNYPPTMTTEEPDAIIVGAGILGCALAVALGTQGRRIVLIERDLSEPDRIVGELLQPGGVHALRQLGLGDCLEGIDAIPEYGYQVMYRDEKVVIPYIGEGDKARQGRSFHHGRFVMNLRAAVRRVAK
jgi:squalene monooxygenase